MEPDQEACYRALSTRDARFDGRFFIAVRTTRIYCRPICPARTAKRENCRFFPSAAAAQGAIFRILQARFPDHAFLGEEGLDSAIDGAEYRWIIDRGTPSARRLPGAGPVRPRRRGRCRG